MRSTSIGMSSSGDSVSCSSSKAERRKKRSNNAMIGGEGTANRSGNGARSGIRKKDDDDDALGLGCGFGCGRWRHDSEDPFGVMGRVRTMIQDRFSSRVDFAEEPQVPRTKRYPVAVNFVEHRL